MRFDGRIAEDFKLVSGTWVNVASVRARAMADALPFVQDVVVAGEARDRLGLLVFLAPEAAGLATSAQAGSPLAQDPGVRRWAQHWLDSLAAAGTGSSNRVTCAMLMDEPPSAAAGELTDKGSLNQRAVLRARATDVQALFASPIDGKVDPRVFQARAHAAAVQRSA